MTLAVLVDIQQFAGRIINQPYGVPVIGNKDTGLQALDDVGVELRQVGDIDTALARQCLARMDPARHKIEQARGEEQGSPQQSCLGIAAAP